VRVAIAAMTPEESLLAIIHGLAAAQDERTSTDWANGLARRRRIGSYLFSTCCARYFHGSPERNKGQFRTKELN
jgi:hypothetical protein